MSFKDFFEQQAGYDVPFANEIRILDKLQSLDPISQIGLDMSLHKKAIGQQRFVQQDSNDLQQDMPLKQKLMQIFQGQSTGEIDKVMQELQRDQKIHYDYLKQPPHENTGSYIWHKTWIKVYQNWIDKLSMKESLQNNDGRYPFIASCPSCDEWLIHFIRDHQVTVSWNEFKKKTQWEPIAIGLGYNIPGERGPLDLWLHKDWSVSFDKVDGYEIYFLTHSGIEYIFGNDQAWKALNQKVKEMAT